MGEAISTVGNLAGACGHDGTDWIKLLVDEDGKLQITVDTSGLPTGAATAANQITMITALQLIDDLRGALDSVDTDELVVNVDESVLPTGAATAANQATMITALQLIDDLRGALDSVDTDELVVNVDESVLPTGAATAANQASILACTLLLYDIVKALNSVGTDELDVVFDGQSMDVEVTQTAPADLATGGHGYVSSAWQKLPMVFGYSSRLVEQMTDTSDAGDNILATTAVPSGEVHVVQSASFWHGDAVARLVQVMARKDADEYTWLYSEDLDPSSVVGTINGNWLLEPGDVIRFYFRSLAAGKTIFAAVWGYKMDIDL